MKYKKKIYKTAYSADEKLCALNLLKRASFEFVAHRYHCTIQTLYRWRRLYDGTKESLEPRYCAPYTPHPNRHTDEEVKHIKDLLKRNPHIGLNELYGKLRLNYAYKRNPVSLYRFLRKNGWYAMLKRENRIFHSLIIRLYISVKNGNWMLRSFRARAMLVNSQKNAGSINIRLSMRLLENGLYIHIKNRRLNLQ